METATIDVNAPEDDLPPLQLVSGNSNDIAVHNGSVIRLKVPDTAFSIMFNIENSGFVFPNSPAAAIVWPNEENPNIPPPAIGNSPITASSPTICVLNVTSVESEQAQTIVFQFVFIPADSIDSPPQLIDPTIVTGPDTHNV